MDMIKEAYSEIKLVTPLFFSEHAEYFRVFPEDMVFDSKKLRESILKAEERACFTSSGALKMSTQDRNYIHNSLYEDDYEKVYLEHAILFEQVHKKDILFIEELVETIKKFYNAPAAFSLNDLSEKLERLCFVSEGDFIFTAEKSSDNLKTINGSSMDGINIIFTSKLSAKLELNVYIKNNSNIALIRSTGYYLRVRLKKGLELSHDFMIQC